jgi:hypothetical protein
MKKWDVRARGIIEISLSPFEKMDFEGGKFFLLSEVHPLAKIMATPKIVSNLMVSN